VSTFAGKSGYQDGGQSTQNRGKKLDSAIHTPTKKQMLVVMCVYTANASAFFQVCWLNGAVIGTAVGGGTGGGTL